MAAIGRSGAGDVGNVRYVRTTPTLGSPLVCGFALSVSLVTSPVAGADPVVDACAQFGTALNLAATNYDEFAYATAGSGNEVDYVDENVWRTNLIGRTALREAAKSALSASRTPGLPAEVSDPMLAWSLHATKLLVVMGLRGGGDSLNASATQLNTDAHNAQMACARNGGQA